MKNITRDPPFLSTISHTLSSRMFHQKVKKIVKHDTFVNTDDNYLQRFAFWQRHKQFGGKGKISIV